MSSLRNSRYMPISLEKCIELWILHQNSAKYIPQKLGQNNSELSFYFNLILQKYKSFCFEITNWILKVFQEVKRCKAKLGKIGSGHIESCMSKVLTVWRLKAKMWSPQIELVYLGILIHEWLSPIMWQFCNWICIITHLLSWKCHHHFLKHYKRCLQ